MREVNFQFLKKTIKPRPYNAHKGSMGCLLSVCGSYGMAGAEILSGQSALRTGVGLLRMMIVNSIYPIVSSVLPEAVYIPVKGNSKGTFSTDDIEIIMENLRKSQGVLVGCGLGKNEDTVSIVKSILKTSNVPMVLDADGINCIVQHIYLLKEKSCPVIITPHLGEMSRLTGLSIGEISQNPEKIAKNFSCEYGVITVLKGGDTIITDGKETYISYAGNPGMATGGSGDVLAGIVASLLAQGYTPMESACAGVFIHGTAGDFAREKYGEASMLPMDIVDCIYKVFKSIEK